MPNLTPDQQTEYIRRAEGHIRNEVARRDLLFKVDEEQWLTALGELGDSPAEAELYRVAKDLKARSGRGTGSGYWHKFSNIKHLMGWLLKRGTCVYCGVDLIGEGYIRDGRATTDHLVPYCRCAELDRDHLNTVPACVFCNARKWDMDPRSESSPPSDSHSG
jgi:5-methylcytosine-specific restriction endonuclease McrA